VQSFVRPLAGVYLIVNLVNGKMYVGSAITARLGNRLHRHLYGASGSPLLAAAVRKYGLDLFAFVLLLTIPGVVSQEDNAELLEL
jgi:group I intron endonuclease